MRTKTLLVTAVLTAAGFATSAMAQVYSVNAVGYVNVTLKKGYNLIANPLNNGGNTLAEILPPTTPLPDDTFIVTWDSAGGTIGAPAADLPTFFPGAGWEPAGPALPPGKAFFMYIADTAPTNTYTVTFVGEVPQGNLSTPVAIGSRYSALASQVPQAGKVTTDLGLQPSNDDTLLLWDKNAGGFGTTLYQYATDVGWNDGQNVVEPTVGVGDGFFLFRVGGPTAWTRTFSVN